jgi:hypothetical protein
MASDRSDLTQVWQRVQAALPSGWTLDSLRCASEGLAPEQRSDDWIAIALGPGGEERRSRAADPIPALEGLVPLVLTTPRPLS